MSHAAAGIPRTAVFTVAATPGTAADSLGTAGLVAGITSR
jgi:hypothetical protein